MPYPGAAGPAAQNRCSVWLMSGRAFFVGGKHGKAKR
nr:MAG TPA: hypothetical protein [Caudoviricetes sp.]